MRPVWQKAKKLSRFSGGELRAYLRERPVPVVLWSKERFIVDHHHLVRACWEAGIEEVFVELQADFSMLNPRQFWENMRRLGWCHLYDQFGMGPREPRLLPEDVRGLADDRYRSLAWALRRAGGYEKSGVPFSDFRWARFLRSRIRLEPGDKAFERGLDQGLRLARSPAARRLPGFARSERG